MEITHDPRTPRDGYPWKVTNANGTVIARRPTRAEAEQVVTDPGTDYVTAADVADIDTP